MKETHRFPTKELLLYRQKPFFVSGESYLLVLGHIVAPGQRKQLDFVLRARECRDGVEAYPFYEADLRALKTDRELLWTITDEGNGTVSLWSDSAKRYLTLNRHGALFSKKKQALCLQQNGELVRFGWDDEAGNRHWLRVATRPEAPYGINFTAGSDDNCSSFALAQRVYGIEKEPQGEKRLTVGTFADIHVDYGIQLFRPYLRKGVFQMAKGYAKNYDLDALIMCGDSISDNGSYPSYPRGGAMQGKWPYKRWLKTRNLLHETLQKSFRNQENKGNIFHLTGNHDYQVGDRQPEGQTFNSAYYTDLLPSDIMYPLTQKVTADLGSDECLLCYEYRVKNVPFLVLNTPVYPFVPGAPFPDRACPAHTLEQYDWLEARLTEIKEEQGEKAVIFVSSHYPLWPNQYNKTEGIMAPNYEAYVKINLLLNRFPNLFFFYGHAHGGDAYPGFVNSAENMEGNVPIELSYGEVNGKPAVLTQEHNERGRFRSDILETSSFHHLYGGSLSFYSNHYFANNGVKKPSLLTHLDIPMIQGCTVEVYEDRAVVTMNNFGPKAETLACLPGAKYHLKPLVLILKK